MESASIQVWSRQPGKKSISYYSLCRATVALQEMIHNVYVSQYSLQSYSSSTKDATLYAFLIFFCRATVALQEMLHSFYLSYYSLESHSSSTGDTIQCAHFLLFPVELQQLHLRCYTVCAFPTIPCRARVALQEMLHSVHIFYYSLQSYNSSTGDATQRASFLVFPLELQQLYRRCYTVCTVPTIPCRATMALQEMLRSVSVSYYSLQSYNSSTRNAILHAFLNFSLSSYSNSTGNEILYLDFKLFPIT